MDKILDRIRKVLAKANSTNNTAEAEMLMAKVTEMLEAHNIELVDLNRTGDDPMGTERDVGVIWPNTQWLGKMAGCAARYFGCRVVLSQVTKNKKHMHVVGRESARVTFQLMLPYLVSQVRRQAKVLQEQGMSKLVSERQVANALTERLWILHLESKQRDRVRVEAGSSSALVPIDEIEAEMSSAFPGLRQGKSSVIKTSNAARKLAEGISLHRQTTGNSTRRITK
jgi:hypothetical protein